MAGFPLPWVKARYFDANGAPLAGGKLYTYEAGTSTPAPTYTDEQLSVPNANPVVLDANGEAVIFIPDASVRLYKLVLKDASDVEQWSVDNVTVPNTEAAPAAQAVPTGCILAFGGTAAPSGYLMCDGSAVSRTTYSALFAAISTAYGGGDGTTTFNVPDMRGRFPFGKATAGTGNTLGGTFGSIDHTHTGPSHTHAVTVPRDNWGSAIEVPPGESGRIRVSNSAGTGADASGYFATADQVVTSAAGRTGATGTGNPPALTHNYVIKT